MKVLKHFSYPKISDNSILSKNKSRSTVRMCCESRITPTSCGWDEGRTPVVRQHGRSAGSKPISAVMGYWESTQFYLCPRNILSIHPSFAQTQPPGYLNIMAKVAGLSRSPNGAKLVTFAGLWVCTSRVGLRLWVRKLRLFAHDIIPREICHSPVQVPFAHKPFSTYYISWIIIILLS
ncbi:MAG: hypothetical protein LBC30_00975 [Puniceicoccales bacterium]|jgi:hypothetical protein|nr:hypothetical protein [Puniceicoccales bacterium]